MHYFPPSSSSILLRFEYVYKHFIMLVDWLPLLLLLLGCCFGVLEPFGLSSSISSSRWRDLCSSTCEFGRRRRLRAFGLSVLLLCRCSFRGESTVRVCTVRASRVCDCLRSLRKIVSGQRSANINDNRRNRFMDVRDIFFGRFSTFNLTRPSAVLRFWSCSWGAVGPSLRTTDGPEYQRQLASQLVQW